jgi:hypothetical protein
MIFRWTLIYSWIRIGDLPFLIKISYLLQLNLVLERDYDKHLLVILLDYYHETVPADNEHCAEFLW